MLRRRDVLFQVELDSLIPERAQHLLHCLKGSGLGRCGLMPIVDEVVDSAGDLPVRPPPVNGRQVGVVVAGLDWIFSVSVLELFDV